MSVSFSYRVLSPATGLTIQVVLGYAGKFLTELQVGQVNHMQFSAPYIPAAGAFVLIINGTRAIDYEFEIIDIVLTQGESLPFIPNHHKQYIES